MTLQVRETVTIALVALLVAGIVVFLILCIFLVSGQKELLSQMLQSAAEGNVGGVAFTAGGPFAMWVIAFVLLRVAHRSGSRGAIKLVLQFPDPEAKPPTKPSEFRKAKCWFVVTSNGSEIAKKDVTIQTECVSPHTYVPYIYVDAPNVKNADIQVFLKYDTEEWLSDSYSPRKGSVDLR